MLLYQHTWFFYCYYDLFQQKVLVLLAEGQYFLQTLQVF